MNIENISSNSEAREYATKILSRVPDLCSRLGVSPSSQILGFGVHGVVLLGSKGRAIKVTTSEKEAKVSQVLVGRRLKNVVKVYSVHRAGHRRIWFVCMERLHKLPKSRLKNVEWHPSVCSGYDSLRRLGYDHMDIHEHNIMLCPKSKTLKLIDFGCACPVRKPKTSEPKRQVNK